MKWGAEEVGGLGLVLEALFCLISGIKRTHPNLAAFRKHPPFDSENNDGQQCGWACREKKSRRETEARQFRPAATERVKARVPTPTGFPRSQFWTEQIPLQNIARSHLLALRGETEETSGRISSEPGPPDRRVARGCDFFPEMCPGAKTRSWRGVGKGHALRRTFHARGQLLAQSGLCLGPLFPSSREAAADPPEKGRARQRAPRFRRSPAGRVSAGRRGAPGAARRQPSHRRARPPLRDPGLSGVTLGGAQGPGGGHPATGSSCRVAALHWLQHGRWRDRGG